jgi:hypothetical protein
MVLSSLPGYALWLYHLHQQDARPSACEVFRRLHASCAAHIDGFEAAAAEAGGSGLLDTLPEPYG